MSSALNFDKTMVSSFWNEHMKAMIPMGQKSNVRWKLTKPGITK